MLVRLFWGFVLLLSFGVPAALCQSPSNNPAPDGKAIFDQQCVKCHGQLGEGVRATITMAGPPLLAVHDPATVLTAMEVGPSHMPRFAFVLSMDQMRAVATYVTQKIAVIPMNQGSITEGGQYYRLYCDACHGPAARGDVLAFVGVNPPSLARASPPVVAAIIRTGFGPMPSFPPQELSDEQLDSIVKYVQFMQHPPDPGGSPLGYFGPVAEGFIAWMALFVIIGICVWIEKGGKG
jgi:ubiquinol-cytochrome c reductase cytochrome c subunit